MWLLSLKFHTCEAMAFRENVLDLPRIIFMPARLEPLEPLVDRTGLIRDTREFCYMSTAIRIQVHLRIHSDIPHRVSWVTSMQAAILDVCPHSAPELAAKRYVDSLMRGYSHSLRFVLKFYAFKVHT